MRYAVLMVAMGLVVGAAGATIPDADYCTVTPCDAYGAVLMCPDYSIALGMVSPIADTQFTVNVRNGNNDPIPAAYVEIVLGTPGNHVLCADAVLTGTTDVNGDVTFNISGGGCTLGTDAVRIIANTYEIRSYAAAKSPDFVTGTGGSGYVDLSDFGEFAACYGSPACPCHDYDGDGTVLLADFGMFAAAYGHKCQEL